MYVSSRFSLLTVSAPTPRPPALHSTPLTFFQLPLTALLYFLLCSAPLQCSGQVFVRCLRYADDIVLLSPSCFGLRKIVSICENFGVELDIKFNPLKSQLATFGGNNSSDVEISTGY